MSNVSTQDLLDSGIALVGMPYGTKSPIAKSWNHKEMAIRTSQHAGELIGKNIGIAHAYCTPNATCALDIDQFDHASSWLMMHEIDLYELVLKENTVLIRSGKPKSLKILYRLPASVGILESKKIVGPVGNSAIEFRCATKEGKTVQDVLPPSRHPDGHIYRWGKNSNPLAIPLIPDNLLALWQLMIHNTSRVAYRKRGVCATNNVRPETPREIANIQAALNHIDADCGYDIWRNVVWSILSTGWLCAEDMALAWSKTKPDRFEENSFWCVANSFIPGHANQITVGSLYYYARQGGWNG